MISINIDKEWRGKGLGGVFLQELSTFLHKSGIKANRLIGKVKVGNALSQRAFEKTGFQKCEEREFLEYIEPVE